MAVVWRYNYGWVWSKFFVRLARNGLKSRWGNNLGPLFLPTCINWGKPKQAPCMHNALYEKITLLMFCIVIIILCHPRVHHAVCMCTHAMLLICNVVANSQAIVVMVTSGLRPGHVHIIHTKPSVTYVSIQYNLCCEYTPGKIQFWQLNWWADPGIKVLSSDCSGN